MILLWEPGLALETVTVGASPSAAQTLAVVVHDKGSQWPARVVVPAGARCVRNVTMELSVTRVASVIIGVNSVVLRA